MTIGHIREQKEKMESDLAGAVRCIIGEYMHSGGYLVKGVHTDIEAIEVTAFGDIEQRYEIGNVIVRANISIPGITE